MNYEEQYKQETGDKFFGVMDCHEFYNRYRKWLESKLSYEYRRRVAADEYIRNIEDFHSDEAYSRFVSPESIAESRNKYQSIIAESEGGE